MPQASIASKAAATAAVKPTYTVAQQAWLHFVDKVRRGEQVDPTGQYVKDGTVMPADAVPHTRPKLDVMRDKYPFRLKADGTVVLLSELIGMGSKEAPPGNSPVECPPGEYCPGGTSQPPVITSTFVSSVGLGGTGDIVDMKVTLNGLLIQVTPC